MRIIGVFARVVLPWWRKKYMETANDRFNIYEGGTIHEISEQPAGEYRGTTTVTIIRP